MRLDDFASAAYDENPYPLYEQLRAAGPIVKLAPDMIATGRYDVVQAVLANPDMGRDHLTQMRFRYGERAKDQPAFIAGSRGLHMLNPPEHTSLRRSIMKAFNGQQIERLRDLIQSATDRLIDALDDRREADLVKDFAYPLPVEIICGIMDLPVSDSAMLLRNIRSCTALMAISRVSEAQLEEANEATRILHRYFSDVIEKRRIQPGNDLISLLLSTESGDDPLVENDIFANAIFFFIAGHETTANMIGNMLLCLFQHPKQLDLLKHKPELLSNAVSECLRYDSSVQRVHRQVLKDTEIFGIPLQTGTTIVVFTASANRDPAYFDRADEFLIDRQKQQNHPLSFGSGPHFCIGARLATLQLEIALSTLLRRAPRMTLKDLDQLRWRHTFRGVESLKAAW